MRKFLFATIAFVVLFFVVYNVLIPEVATPDEFLAAGDGVMISNYLREILHGRIHHPVQFLYEYQATTMGLMINIYPPFVSTLYAISFMIFGISMLSARIVHLFFMIGFLCVFYVVLQRQYKERIAQFAVILLLINFSFMKYSSILVREVAYAFFIFLCIYFLQQFASTKKNVYIYCLLGAFFLGAMTKDFFLLCVPALGIMYLSIKRFDFKKSLRAINVPVALVGIFVALCTFGYYALKLNTSAKEKSFLLGGFDPISGIIQYSGFLFKDNPVLLLVFVASVLFIVLRKSFWQKWSPDALYLILFMTFFVFLICVHQKHIRYIFMFYIVSAIIISRAFSLLSKKTQTGLLVLLLVGILLSSVANVLHREKWTDDRDLVPNLKEYDANGNILMLSSYRFDVGFYLRAHNYNLDHVLILPYFEKNNAGQLPYSRFSAFYKDHPVCKDDFSIACWRAFSTYANVTTVIVDKTPAGDSDIEEYSALFTRPIFETQYSRVYRMDEENS